MATKKTIKLLLVENVDNLGIVGDVVEVRPGYARNYLVPMGLAAEPTAGNMKRIEARRAEVERQMRELREQQETMIEHLKDTEITLQRSANPQGQLYGSVTQYDIAAALQDEGFAITERDVRIGTPIKQLDSYEIPIQLAADLKTSIKLWVVSDKPMDELHQELDDTDQGEGEVAETVSTDNPQPISDIGDDEVK